LTWPSRSWLASKIQDHGWSPPPPWSAIASAAVGFFGFSRLTLLTVVAWEPPTGSRPVPPLRGDVGRGHRCRPRGPSLPIGRPSQPPSTLTRRAVRRDVPRDGGRSRPCQQQRPLRLERGHPTGVSSETMETLVEMLANLGTPEMVAVTNPAMADNEGS
jgi:hypothetical protein